MYKEWRDLHDGSDCPVVDCRGKMEIHYSYCRGFYIACTVNAGHSRQFSNSEVRNRQLALRFEELNQKSKASSGGKC